MNKKLITLAVAAAMTAPAAALAEATIYGVLHESLDYVDVDEFALWGAVPISSSGDADLEAAAEAYAFGVVPGDTSGIASPPATPGTTVPAGSADIVVGVIPVANANTLGGADTAFADAFNAALVAGANEDVSFVRGLQAQLDFANLNVTSAQKLDAAAWAAVQGSGSITERDDREYKGWGLGMNPRSSRIGVKGSEDLGAGLKAIYQVEMAVDLSNDNRDDNILNGNRGNSFAMRNSFVGLAGNFGTFLIGRHDTPYKISMGKLDMFADTMADFNHTVGFHDIRADSVVAYISPSWSGFQFAGAVIPSGGATPLGDFNKDANGIADAWSVAAIYQNGPFYGSVGYELISDEHWRTFDGFGGIQLQDWYQGLYLKDTDDDTKWSVGLGLLDWNGFSLTGRYERRSNVLGAPRSADSKLWQVQAAYAFGNNTIKGMYGSSDLESCTDTFGHGFGIVCGRGLDIARQKDKSTWAVGFDHNFSKRTRAYLLYTAMDDDASNSDWNAFSLGMIHKF